MAQQLLCYVPRVLGFQNLLATCPKLPHAPVMLLNFQQFGSKLIDYVQLLFQNVTFPVWTFPILEGRLKQDAKLRQNKLIALASVCFRGGTIFKWIPLCLLRLLQQWMCQPRDTRWILCKVAPSSNMTLNLNSSLGFLQHCVHRI